MDSWTAGLSLEELKDIATQIRCDIIEMTTAAGSGHPGGSLSATDILTALYFGGIICHDPKNPNWPGRDRFVLSKGHVAPVLYAALARAGYFEVSELATLRKFGSRLQGHPDRLKLPGVEVSAGSLGQGLSVSSGLAYALRADAAATGRQPNHVFTLLGDGECQEGQVWEAAMFAGNQGLSNLVAIIDRNGLQIDGATAEINDLRDLGQKFECFGWRRFEVDGHDLSALMGLFTAILADPTDRPTCVIAHTVKGKGVSFMENQAAWHGVAPNAEQCAAALAELRSPLGHPEEQAPGHPEGQPLGRPEEQAPGHPEEQAPGQQEGQR